MTIKFTKGNLLDAKVEALVNTVNTVGVMGKGIALMFKERFPHNMVVYEKACKAKQVNTGIMFITETGELTGPRWIVNFPTKQHWRGDSRMVWIESGLDDLCCFIIEHKVRSIAIPPLGAGNGGLDWNEVKPKIQAALEALEDVEVLVYEPTQQYQNVAKKTGVTTLTPERAMIAELIRRYWVLGIECSLLEIQKLAWFLNRAINRQGLANHLKLKFEANYYGPFAPNLNHLLNALDGSYLGADKRIPDCQPLDVIAFVDERKDTVHAYLNTEAKDYLPALKVAIDLIDGFESPYGMELLSTVDWLLTEQQCEPNLESIKSGLARWPAGEEWAIRKLKLFDDKSLQFAIDRLSQY